MSTTDNPVSDADVACEKGSMKPLGGRDIISHIRKVPAPISDRNPPATVVLWERYVGSGLYRPSAPRPLGDARMTVRVDGARSANIFLLLTCRPSTGR